MDRFHLKELTADNYFKKDISQIITDGPWLIIHRTVHALEYMYCYLMFTDQ